jgi:cellulose biosynthesis protein BcsQ
MKTITFFNNKGGVGKSTFAYHMGFMLENEENRVLFVDLDPQCNLTAHICSDKEIESIWNGNNRSVYHAVQPLTSGAGDIVEIDPYQVENRKIYLLPGDLLLSDFESFLAETWVQVLARQERGFRSLSAIHRLIEDITERYSIDYVIIDVGPNFGSLNRAVMLGCDAFFVPMIPDLFSLRGSQNLGRVLANWIEQYQDALSRAPDWAFTVPKGYPVFCGYITQQFNIYRQKEAQAWQRWGQMVPNYIQSYVVTPLQHIQQDNKPLVSDVDNLKLGEFKNYHSLIPMAQAALKPVFELTAANGVVGAHHEYVRNCRREFEQMARKLVDLVENI